MIWYCFIPIGLYLILFLSIIISEKCFYKKVNHKVILYLVGGIITAICLIAISAVYFWG